MDRMIQYKKRGRPFFTILSVAITSYFCCSSNWSVMDAFYSMSYKMPGKKANRLQTSVRLFFYQNNGNGPEQKIRSQRI
jgi:hypothetical protein